MRIVDMKRCEGEKLAAIWLYVDILRCRNMQDVDILAPATETMS